MYLKTMDSLSYSSFVDLFLATSQFELQIFFSFILSYWLNSQPFDGMSWDFWVSSILPSSIAIVFCGSQPYFRSSTLLFLLFFAHIVISFPNAYWIFLQCFRFVYGSMTLVFLSAGSFLLVFCWLSPRWTYAMICVFPRRLFRVSWISRSAICYSRWPLWRRFCVLC